MNCSCWSSEPTSVRKNLLHSRREHQEKNQHALDDLLGKVSGMDLTLTKISAASDEVRDYVFYIESHALRTAKLFLGTVMACVVLMSGTLRWSHHLMSGLAQDKADLRALDIKLKHTPVIVHFKNKDYVRVLPHSETGFTRGDGSKVPGRYAEVWHAQ